MTEPPWGLCLGGRAQANQLMVPGLTDYTGLAEWGETATWELNTCMHAATTLLHTLVHTHNRA